ncbi:hypothetical protein AAVH_40268, partial [Aphelenchoides avenae]
SQCSNEDSDKDVSQATTSSRRKKKDYSVKFKLQVVEWAKLNRNNDGQPNKLAAARTSAAGFFRPVGSKMRKGGNLAKNLPGGGRPIKDKHFELQLNDLVSEGRAGKYKEGNGMPDGVASLVQARQEAQAKDLPELMQGLEVEAPEDPEDDAGNDSDVSVIGAEDQAAEESEEFEEVEDSDSDF